MLDQAAVIDRDDTREAVQTIAGALAGLDQDARTGVIAVTVADQTVKAQKEVVETVQAGLRPPDDKTSGRLWYIIVIGLFLVTALSAIFGFVLLYASKDSAAAWALASAAAGGIIGLIAPSPASKSGAGT